MKRTRGRPPTDDRLTPAEWKVVDAVRHGLTNPHIARLQGVTIDAVKYHVSQVLQKLGLSSRRELQRWRGVPRRSPLAASEPSAAQPIQLGPLSQVARSVKDVDASKTWYADVLGLRHLYSFGALAFFDCGGVRLLLSSDAGDVQTSILYFRVADIKAAQVALAGRGVVFTHAPHLIHRHPDGTEEWMAFFNDNEGRPLALLSQVRAAAKSAG